MDAWLLLSLTVWLTPTVIENGVPLPLATSAAAGLGVLVGIGAKIDAGHRGRVRSPMVAPVGIGLGIAGLLVLWFGTKGDATLVLSEAMTKIGVSLTLVVIACAVFLAIAIAWRADRRFRRGPTLVTAFGCAALAADLLFRDGPLHPSPTLIIIGFVAAAILAGVGRVRHAEGLDHLLDRGGTIVSLILGLAAVAFETRRNSIPQEVAFEIWFQLIALAFVCYFITRYLLLQFVGLR